MKSYAVTNLTLTKKPTAINAHLKVYRKFYLNIKGLGRLRKEQISRAAISIFMDMPKA